MRKVKAIMGEGLVMGVRHRRCVNGVSRKRLRWLGESQISLTILSLKK